MIEKIVKKYLIILLIGFLIISLCSAEVQTLGTFKQGQIINLIQSCENSTYSNITRVLYPNSSLAINGQYNMTRTGDDYSYHFTQSEQLGQYLVYGNCDENGFYTKWVYDFYTTPTGDNRGNSFILILEFSAIILLGFAFIMKNKILGFISGIAFVIAGVYIMIYGFLDLTDVWTRSVALISIGLGVIFMIISSLEILQDE